MPFLGSGPKWGVDVNGRRNLSAIGKNLGSRLSRWRKAASWVNLFPRATHWRRAALASREGRLHAQEGSSSDLDNFEGPRQPGFCPFFVLNPALADFPAPVRASPCIGRKSSRGILLSGSSFGASYAAARLATANRVTIQFRPFPKWVGDAAITPQRRRVAVLLTSFVVVRKSLTVIRELGNSPTPPALDWQLSYMSISSSHRLYAHVRPHHFKSTWVKFILKKSSPRQTG